MHVKLPDYMHRLGEEKGDQSPRFDGVPESQKLSIEPEH